MFTISNKAIHQTKNLKTKKRGSLIATIAQEEAKPVIKEIEQFEIVSKQVSIEVISLENLLTAFQNYLPVLMEAVEEGLQNPLDAFTQVRQICNLAEFYLEKIKPFALKEAEFFHKDELYQLGFEISSTGDSFNFSEDAEVKRLENLLKHRKDLIKSATRHQKTILDEASGEIIKPVSIRSHSTQYLKTIKPK